MQSLVRVKKELKDVQKEEGKSGVKASLVVPNQFNHWKGYVKGPEGTIYDGGIFQVDIIIPDQYPFVPPKMKFDTKVWHPNVSSQTGAICLDILKSEWSPALTLRTALLSLQALLTDANPEDPQDGVVAKQYLRDRKAFNEKARAWTKMYATGEIKPSISPEQQAKINKLKDMGFAEGLIKAKLMECNWDEGRALDKILASV